MWSGIILVGVAFHFYPIDAKYGDEGTCYFPVRHAMFMVGYGNVHLALPSLVAPSIKPVESHPLFVIKGI